jgi:hypothetical protein
MHKALISYAGNRAAGQVVPGRVLDRVTRVPSTAGNPL